MSLRPLQSDDSGQEHQQIARDEGCATRCWRESTVLVRTPALRRITIGLFGCWFLTGVTFWGMSLSGTSFRLVWRCPVCVLCSVLCPILSGKVWCQLWCFSSLLILFFSFSHFPSLFIFYFSFLLYFPIFPLTFLLFVVLSCIPLRLSLDGHSFISLQTTRYRKCIYLAVTNSFSTPV